MCEKFIFFFCILFSSFLFSQKIHKTERICFFQEAKTGLPITIVNDSLIYKGKLKIPTRLKHNEYPENLDFYPYHFALNNRTYFAHDGGGIVLEYRNDSIVRIDKSFLHRNQYRSAAFDFNNQLFLFGGYGLFTFKNIITKYNFNSDEWEELTTNSDLIPEARESADRIVINKNLYIFGGLNMNKKTKPSSVIKDNSIWKLNLETLNWKKLGTINSNYRYTNSRERKQIFQANNKLYLFFIDIIFEIDIYKNTLNYYENKSGIDPFMQFYDSKTELVYILNTISSTNEIELKKIKLSKLLNNNTPFKSETFYTSDSYLDRKSYLAIILLFTIISFFIIKQFKKKNANYIVYNTKTNLLTYRLNIIPNLNAMEEKFLIYLIQNKDEFIQHNALKIFYENGNQENFNAIIKKRDIVLSQLFFKLQLVLGIEKEEFIIKQNNEIDNRIKEIKLNSLFFRIK